MTDRLNEAFPYVNNQMAKQIANGEIRLGHFEPVQSFMVKTAATFDVILPPSGWHLRVVNDAKKAGLTGTITYDDGTTADLTDGMTHFGKVMEAEDPNNMHAVVNTDDPETFWSIYKKWGGTSEPQEMESDPDPSPESHPDWISSVKTAEDKDQLYTGDDSDAVTCPNCGSHTVRMFDVGQQRNVADLKCLTCGNEFQHQVYKNPVARVAKDDYTCDNCDRGLSAQEAMKGRLNNGSTVCSECSKTLHKLHTSSAPEVNSDLPDTPIEYFLDSMAVTAAPQDMSQLGEPYAAPYGLPNEQDTSGQNYGMPQGMQEEDGDYAVATCPACGNSGMLLGDLGDTTWFRCRSCGTDFHENDKKSSSVEDIEDEKNRRLREHLDSTGQKLQAGSWYSLIHQNAGVPDRVQILNLHDDRIEAAIHPDERDPFPIVIESTDEYSFAPVEAGFDKTAIDLEGLSKFFIDSGLTGFEAPHVVHDVYTRLIGGEHPDSIKSDLVSNAAQQKGDMDESTKNVLYGLVDDLGWMGRGASFVKEAPGDKHLPYATPKRNRQYEHILESCKREHPDWDTDRCKELAASTVNKERKEKGETKGSNWRLASTREARRHFTSDEQKELIDENPDGRARNLHKLDLKGTHYTTFTRVDDDPEFLWS